MGAVPWCNGNPTVMIPDTHGGTRRGIWTDRAVAVVAKLNTRMLAIANALDGLTRAEVARLAALLRTRIVQ